LPFFLDKDAFQNTVGGLPLVTYQPGSRTGKLLILRTGAVTREEAEATGRSMINALPKKASAENAVGLY